MGEGDEAARFDRSPEKSFNGRLFPVNRSSE
jgi:hypothetical protein